MDLRGKIEKEISMDLSGRQKGFTLVELMIAMAIGLVVLGAVFSVFILQNKTFSNQEELVALQQNIRGGMDMVAREIGMAGYDPTGLNTDNTTANDFSGIPVSSSQLQLQADLDGSGSIDTTSQENAIYTYDSTNKKITRNIGGGAQPFLENIEAFTFAYLDGSGNTTTVAANVRQIRIAITGRTANPDPNYSSNGGYRTFALTSVVAVRNLAK